MRDTYELASRKQVSLGILNKKYNIKLGLVLGKILQKPIVKLKSQWLYYIKQKRTKVSLRMGNSTQLLSQKLYTKY